MNCKVMRNLGLLRYSGIYLSWLPATAVTSDEHRSSDLRRVPLIMRSAQSPSRKTQKKFKRLKRSLSDSQMSLS